MNKYEHGKVYKIVCNKTGMVYVGSTREKYLSRRLNRHKYDYKAWVEGRKKTGMTSFKIIENGDCEIILLESCPCKNVYELRNCERKWIETLECVNKKVPNRTRKEYRKIHKEKFNMRAKKIRETEKWKEYMKGYNKTYKQVNKERLKEVAREQCKCQCGSAVMKYNKQRHLKTKKHQNFVNKKS